MIQFELNCFFFLFADETPIEEVTNSLYGKSLKFVMTHDMELKLPDMVFDGATFRISPRSFEGNGAIVKLELIPKAEIEARNTGKLFFIRKRIRKYLSFQTIFLNNYIVQFHMNLTLDNYILFDIMLWTVFGKCSVLLSLNLVLKFTPF